MKTNKELIKNFPVVKIKPYDRNPRRNDHAVDLLVRSIERVGNNDPIEVNENNVVLCGHTRLKALKKLGIKETDVVVISGLSEKQQNEYRVTNNKTGELAEWDFEILESDFDNKELEIMGFDSNEPPEKIKELSTSGYKKIHVLLSFSPDDYIEIQGLLDQIKLNQKIEYEQTAN